jgi:hypothetical protein
MLIANLNLTVCIILSVENRETYNYAVLSLLSLRRKPNLLLCVLFSDIVGLYSFDRFGEKVLTIT